MKHLYILMSLLSVLVVLLFFQGCGETSENFEVTIKAPDQTAKEAIKTLRVYAIISNGDETNCQNLLNGSASPNDSNNTVADSESVSDPTNNKIRPLKVPKKHTGTLLFFSQGEDDGGNVIFGGCTEIKSGEAARQIVISLDHAYTVTFDGDGATVDANPTTITVILPATTVGTLPTEPTKDGYTFGGWYTENNGGGTEFTASTAVTASIMVYAYWICTPNCTNKICGANDGCDGKCSAGTCTAPNSCGGGGTPNVCGHLTSQYIGNLVLAPTGTFLRDGSITDTRTVSAFHISQYLITQAQYYAITGNKPSWNVPPNVVEDHPDRPVDSVTWYDAVDFCNKLSDLEGLTEVYTITGRTPATGYPITSATVTMNIANNGYRLPTEMEWMWAAMGATSGSGYTGDTYTVGYGKEFAGDPNPTTSGDPIGNYAWYKVNAYNVGGSSPDYGTHSVGTKLPNELGLYDMSGNVDEWCWDWNSDSYITGSFNDYTGPTSGTERVLKGGEWNNVAGNASLTVWGVWAPENRSYYTGFRVVRP